MDYANDRVCATCRNYENETCTVLSSSITNDEVEIFEYMLEGEAPFLEVLNDKIAEGVIAPELIVSINDELVATVKERIDAIVSSGLRINKPGTFGCTNWR